MINKMNNTTINANPPVYAPLIITPPFQGDTNNLYLYDFIKGKKLQ
nr:hypothetical protein [Metabacillus litoralis]